MKLKKTQKVVRIIAGLILVLAAFLIYRMTANIQINNEFIKSNYYPGGDLGLRGLGNFITFVAFIIPAILLIINSLGLWFFKNWARILLVTLSIIFLVAYPLLHNFNITLIEALMVGASVFMIYLFAFNKSIKQVFEKQKPAKLKKKRKK